MYDHDDGNDHWTADLAPIVLKILFEKKDCKGKRETAPEISEHQWKQYVPAIKAEFRLLPGKSLIQ